MAKRKKRRSIAEAYERNGTLYVRGTVRIDGRSRRIFASTGINASDPQAKEKFDEVRRRVEQRTHDELLYGTKHIITWSESAASYGERRQERRLTLTPESAEQEDGFLALVKRITDYFISIDVADKPLRLLTKAHVNAFFKECHKDKGNSLATMKKSEAAYRVVMNFAVREFGLPADYPRPDMPDYEPKKLPVNKWLYPEEIEMLRAAAPKHIKPMFAVAFGAGRRWGELYWAKRRPPITEDEPGTFYIGEEGKEHLFIRRTKNGDPKIVWLPDWAISEINAWLATREDDYEELFLTRNRTPYTVPRHQTGTLIRTAWRTMVKRVADQLEVEGKAERAGVVRSATPHWARHNAASHLVMGGASDSDVDSFMGWRDGEMRRRYSHLSPEHQKELANRLDFTKRTA